MRNKTFAGIYRYGGREYTLKVRAPDFLAAEQIVRRADRTQDFSLIDFEDSYTIEEQSRRIRACVLNGTFERVVFSVELR